MGWPRTTNFDWYPLHPGFNKSCRQFYCPCREPLKGWPITTKFENNLWTRPGTEGFLVRLERKGKWDIIPSILDPDG
jgi:hypothetical protein